MRIFEPLFSGSACYRRSQEFWYGQAYTVTHRFPWLRGELGVPWKPRQGDTGWGGSDRLWCVPTITARWVHPDTGGEAQWERCTREVPV